MHYLETERQLKLSKNGIITLNRGDTFTLPIHINLGSGVAPDYGDEEGEKYKTYILRNSDKLYFALLLPNQKWEDAIVKKVRSANDIDPESKTILLHFYPEDTEYLVPGNYYYQIKLYRCPQSTEDHHEHIDTIVPRTKFVILE